MSRTSVSWRRASGSIPRSAGCLAGAVGGLGDDLLAVGPVPDREPVAPPQLARDAPGPDVLHPVEVDALVAARGRSAPRRARRPSIAGAASSSIRQNHCSEISGSIRSPERCGERDRVRRRAPRRAAVPRRAAPRPPPRGPRPRSSPRRSRPPSALIRPSSPITVISSSPWRAADLEVVGVVAGGDLQRPGAELGVDVLVGDDRQPPADQRQDAVRADERRDSARRRGSRRRRCRRASSPGAPWPPSAPRRSPRPGSRSSTGCR